MKYLLTLIMVVSMVLGMVQTAHALKLETSLKTIEGQVTSVTEDEEGWTISIKTSNNKTKSVYVPRARANQEIIERAKDAMDKKTTYSISSRT
jgi:hypothetical protein